MADLLRAGENEIEIWLADGWLRSQLMWGQAPLFNVWGEHIAGIVEVEGSDAWFIRPIIELVPADLACPRCGKKDFVI